MSKISGAILVVGILLLSWLLYAISVSLLWGWFVSPVFGLPLLSYAQSFGLSLLVCMLTHQMSAHELDLDDEQAWKLLLVNLLRPLGYIFVGYVVTLFL